MLNRIFKIVLIMSIFASFSFAEEGKYEEYYDGYENEEEYEYEEYEEYKDYDEYEEDREYYEEYENEFNTSKVMNAIGLNILVPGLGSLLIMDNIPGAVVQWGLFGSGISLLVYNRVTCGTGLSCLSAVGFSSFMFSYLAGVFSPLFVEARAELRIINRKDGFNIAILPNEHGDFKTYLFYNKMF